MSFTITLNDGTEISLYALSELETVTFIIDIVVPLTVSSLAAVNVTCFSAFQSDCVNVNCEGEMLIRSAYVSALKRKVTSEVGCDFNLNARAAGSPPSVTVKSVVKYSMPAISLSIIVIGNVTLFNSL